MKHLFLFPLAVAALWASIVFAAGQDGLPGEDSTCVEAATTIEQIREEIRQLRSSIMRDCFSSAARKYDCWDMRRRAIKMRERRMAWEKWRIDNCGKEK